MNGNSTERAGRGCCFCLPQASAASFSPQSQDVPRRLYMSCPVIDTLLLFVGSIFKYSADLEPWCTLECTEHSLAGEEARHSIWDLTLHSVGVEVNIPRPPWGFEKGKW